MNTEHQQKVRRQQLLWWIAALLWVMLGIVSCVLKEFYPKLEPLFFLILLISPFILTLRVPEGMFRSVRTASPDEKISLGFFLMMLGAVGIGLGFAFIMSWLQSINAI